MFCRKCIAPVYDQKEKDKIVGYRQGRVFIDRVFSEHNHVELFCIQCGKRWMIDKESGVFGRWINSIAST